MDRGYWLRGEFDQALRLYGVGPSPAAIRQVVRAYVLTVFHFYTSPEVGPELFAQFTLPANRPEMMREVPSEELFAELTDRETSQHLLLKFIDAEMEEIRTEEERLRVEVEDVEWKPTLDEHSILDEAALRRYNRFHEEMRVTFGRAYSQLEALLKRGERAWRPRSRGIPRYRTTRNRRPAPQRGRPRSPRGRTRI